MIDVKNTKHSVSGVVMVDLSATHHGTSLLARLALHGAKGTCGEITISSGDLSQETQDAWLKFVELVEKDAAKRLFDLSDSDAPPEESIPEISPY